MLRLTSKSNHQYVEPSNSALSISITAYTPPHLSITYRVKVKVKWNGNLWRKTENRWLHAFSLFHTTNFTHMWQRSTDNKFNLNRICKKMEANIKQDTDKHWNGYQKDMKFCHSNIEWDMRHNKPKTRTFHGIALQRIRHLCGSAWNWTTTNANLNWSWVKVNLSVYLTQNPMFHVPRVAKHELTLRYTYKYSGRD